MLDTIANYSRCAMAASLLLLFCGCQSWADLKARFAPPPPGPSSPLTAGSEDPPPLTKTQKLDMQMAVGRACESDGNLEEAIKNYADVLKKDGTRAEAAHRIAILYDMKGEPEKSRGYYLEAIKKAPERPELYCDFGYSCYLQRNWREAETNLRKALELNPEMARAHVNLGMLLARTGRSSPALNEFARAGLGEAAARSNLALADVQEERWTEAQQEYERALSVDPNSKSAKLGLAALESQTFNAATPEARAALPSRMPPAVQPQMTVAVKGDSPIFADTKIGTVPSQAPAPRAVRPEPPLAAPPQMPPAVPAQAPVVMQAQTPPPVSPEPQMAAQPQQMPPSIAPAQELPKPEPEPKVAEQAQPQATPVAVPPLAPPAVQSEPAPNEPSPAVAQVSPAQQEPPVIAQPQRLPPIQAETAIAGQAETPSTEQTESQPEVRPLPPPTEQAEAPATAPAHAPDEEAAPSPPVRPPVETALRGPEETSPDTRRY